MCRRLVGCAPGMAWPLRGWSARWVPPSIFLSGKPLLYVEPVMPVGRVLFSGATVGTVLVLRPGRPGIVEAGMLGTPAALEALLTLGISAWAKAGRLSTSPSRAAPHNALVFI